MEDITYLGTFNAYASSDDHNVGKPMLIVLAEKYIREHRDGLSSVEDDDWKHLCSENYQGLFSYFPSVPRRSDVEVFIAPRDNDLGLFGAYLVEGAIVAARFSKHNEVFNPELYQFRLESQEKVRGMTVGAQKWFFKPRQQMQ